MKTRFTAVILILMISQISLHAQQEVFEKVYYFYENGIEGYAIAKSPDQNYVVAGRIYNLDALYQKTDPLGNIIWSKKFNLEPAEVAYFSTVAATSDSCFLLGGNTYSNTIYKTILVKTNSDGDVLWTKSVNLDAHALVRDMHETSDHGFVVTVQFWLPSYNSSAFVMKLDANGNILWKKSIKIDDYSTLPASIKESEDGSFYLGGSATTSTFVDRFGFIAKLSPEGEMIWCKKMNTGTVQFDLAHDLLVSGDELVFFITNMVSSYNNKSAIIVTDPEGNYISGKQYDVELLGSNYEYVNSPKIHQLNDGGLIMAGGNWIGSLLRTDSEGNPLWYNSYYFYGVDALPADDGGFMVLGNGPLWGTDDVPTNNPQIGLIKTDTLGFANICYSTGNAAATTLTSSPEEVSFTVTEVGTVTDIPYITEPVFPLIYNGCVAIVGAVNENNSPEHQLSVIPNPSSGQFQVKVEDHKSIQFNSLEIYNPMGKKVFETYNPGLFNSEIDLRNQPEGIYIVKCCIGGKQLTGKVVIMK